MSSIDWQRLMQMAKQAYENAYAPYSNFKVGAAAIDDEDNRFCGCNVENASYGLTVCAERNCFAQLIVNGATTAKALVVYTEQEKLTPPCGACRQVIVEFMAPDAQVKAMNHLAQEKTWSVKELLPDAFTPKDLT
ncbi:cytidine deaminase [Thalassotalea sp. M1531]|uniref:Cytidine deaminase n=1 Tax=Thalassotalea algicola TaxID=2716224 RepID=A0A7Y0Q624_9GAMM|nr:cytidine deaminase [Thalassotalea algicola]NMP31549.1 cytidine deaminase [Thalassotalea algicola]